MDSFVRVHTEPGNEGPYQGTLTMGYYTRADLPYYYALADAFTLCDGYHCSVMGPTHPNRLMQMSGTLDPAGKAGGPVVVTNGSPVRPVQRALGHHARGPGGRRRELEVLQPGRVALQHRDHAQDRAHHRQRASLLLPVPRTRPRRCTRRPSCPPSPVTSPPTCRPGTLPKVSWISTPVGYDEHPPAPSFLGEWFTDQVLRTLVSNPDVWSKTVLFHMYDENDGFFDHVAPPVAPPGTEGEFLTVAAAARRRRRDRRARSASGSGCRMLVLSPFSRGGRICSQTFDHTSQLRFIEERFGVQAPNLSDWRRSTVGDLTATLHMDRSRHHASPIFPPPATTRPTSPPRDAPRAICWRSPPTSPPYPVPTTQQMPTQE